MQDSNNSEIDEDWLENFDAEARKKNTTEMQSYFAKILAGEIIAPNSFSIKSLRILGNMDKQVARLFQKFCSNCILLSEFGGKPIDARMISISGNVASNSLSKYGFTFGKLNILNEYGLVISDYNSWIDFSFVLRIDPPQQTKRRPTKHSNDSVRISRWPLDVATGIDDQYCKTNQTQRCCSDSIRH